MNIEEFVKERNEALLSLDGDKIRETFVKFDVPFPKNEKIFWAGVHKARLMVSSFSDEVKATSTKWLIDNGFNPLIR